MMGHFNRHQQELDIETISSRPASDALVVRSYAGRRHHWRSPNSIMTTAPTNRR